MRCCSPFAFACWMTLVTVAAGDDVGSRPYEMEWAGRATDTHEPLIDFEDAIRWETACDGAVAEFSRSRQQQLWGNHVGKLVYRGTSPQPKVTLRRVRSVPMEMPFDCLNLWVYGNNWGWNPDPTTPPVEIRVLLESADGKLLPVAMGRVRWKEWWLMHRRLTSEQLDLLGDQPRFVGLEITYGTNDADRVLYFDNLAAYQEPLPPLKFQSRPQRGIELPPGQSVGVHRGPGQLPFPNRDETILPDNLTREFKVETLTEGDTYLFRYRGSDGELIYRYRPNTGTLGDISAQWGENGLVLRPMDQGGIRFWADNDICVAPETIALVRCERDGDVVESTWLCSLGERKAEVTYRFRLWQKSLVIDVQADTNQIGELQLGRVLGSAQPRLVTLPFLTGAAQRPAILVSGPESSPLFVSNFVDHCRSNSSELWFANRIVETEEGNWIAVQNGGSRYRPKTDGVRNPCFERVFLTVSPHFEETLPNIPNAPSPWKHVTGERLWRAHGASNRQSDYEHWKKVARYGMTKVVITDHETGWRDGGESFTMRTRAAPGKGGDEGQADYARKILALGFRYGIYNNYTDYAPVNEYWDEDYVTRLPDGQWRTAWPRCYNPKPARAVELESRLAPMIQEKFHLNTAYCDVHTAVTPWSYVDYDARVPGAATFAATFYAYGEIMLHQKATWQGPVYSEGNNHWYYCGLTDGNYGQDQVAQLNEQPWLVDFDLRKMHPLCCNFGMGNPGMFFGRNQGLGHTPAERQSRLDRFLAATLAFGHTGFLVFEDGFENAVRSYYSVQQIHARYAQQEVQSIRYADENGRLWDTGAAVASGAYRRSQVATRYQDGLEVLVNGHTADMWSVGEDVLPPNGWVVRDPIAGQIKAFSKLVDGHRADYVDASDYVYANGRGQVTRFEKATCDGQLVALRRENGQVELFPIGKCEVCGVSLDGDTATAEALDESGKSMGPADIRFSRGLVYVTPMPKAVSYLLTPQSLAGPMLACDRISVIPGETVEIDGAELADFRVPPESTVGEQIWHQSNGRWIDFTVCPLASVTMTDAAPMRFHITSHLADEVDAEIRVGERSLTKLLVPEQDVVVQFPADHAKRERVQTVPLEIVADELRHQQTWWVRSEDTIRELAQLDRETQIGQCLRGEEETELVSQSGAQSHRTARACGGEMRDCLFMHPPYRNGTGYSFAVSEAIALPSDAAAAFRCVVGKADGSDPGDGMLFRVLVLDDNQHASLAAEQMWKQHDWTPLEADLSKWAGQTIRLKLVTDAGPKDNTSGDWGCWADLRIEDQHPTLVTSIHSHPVTLTREPGPFDRDDLSLPQIQSARRAVLRFQGIGLQAGPRYISHARINGRDIGTLPAAGGDEANGIWQDARLELPAEVISGLEEWNALEIENPTRDYFKVRRFWIEFELANGQNASSHVTTTAFTQPPSWAHAEGTGVPFGESIETKIRIPLANDNHANQ
jgi:hypothetical protein